MVGENSQDMYQTLQKLDWSAIEFTLIGLRFSVDLNKIPAMNYSFILAQVEKINLKKQFQ